MGLGGGRGGEGRVLGEYITLRSSRFMHILYAAVVWQCSLFLPFLYLLFLSLFHFSNWLEYVVRMRSDRYYVQYIRGSRSWGAKRFFSGASSETYAPVWTWHIVG